MNTKISIIVPVYKRPEQYLRKCIESLISQKLRDIEIILVDDGSPDDCGEICDEYAKKDNRIRVIHKNNEGLSAARNSGSKEAKGEWITFVDADDWIEADMCEKVYNIINNKNIDVAICGYIRDIGNKQVKMKYEFSNNVIFDKQGCVELQKKILNFDSNLSTQPSKFYRRDFIEKNDLYNINELKQGAEGIEFNIRVFDKASSAMFINQFFYHYTYNDTSISSMSSEENNYLVLDCFKKIKETIQKNKNIDEILPIFYTRLLYVIVTTAISGYFHPKNKEKISIKKKKYKKFLNQDIIKEALKYGNIKTLDIKRKIIIILVKIKAFYLIDILAHFRKK